MKYIKAFYVDAKDGLPANVAPNRHGSVLPNKSINVTAVDFRFNPPIILGTLPDDSDKNPAITYITKAEYLALVSDYNNWRESLEVARREQMYVDLAAYRWDKEVGGIFIEGMEIKTDRESQGALTSAFTSLSAGMIPFTDWKAVDGWIKPDLDTIKPIAQAVAEHVAKCFAAERLVCELLDTGVEVDLREEFDKAYLL